MTGTTVRPQAPTLAQLKATVLKPVDAWWVVFVADPIALRLLWLMLRYWRRATPNGVTTVSMIVGLVAAAAFGMGWYGTGAVAYQASFILDCVDGKMARWYRSGSRRGQFWDGLVNTLVYGTAVTGLAWSQVGDGRVVLAAFVLLVTWALQMHTSSYLGAPAAGGHPLLGNQSGGWLARHRLLPPLTFFDKHALLFLVAPLAHIVPEMLAALAILEVCTWVLKARMAWRDTGAHAAAERTP